MNFKDKKYYIAKVKEWLAILAISLGTVLFFALMFYIDCMGGLWG